MLTIQTNKATLLAVRLPKEVTDVIIDSLGKNQLTFIRYVWTEEDGNISSWIKLPIGSWQPLGFASEISELDMERVVESRHIHTNKNIYKDYDRHGFWYTKTDQSFRSLLSKHSITEEYYLLIKNN